MTMSKILPIFGKIADILYWQFLLMKAPMPLFCKKFLLLFINPSC